MTEESKTTPHKLFNTARYVANKMRRSGKYSAVEIYLALDRAFSAGYAEGHEEQMRARILDKREYEQRLNGGHL